MLCAMATNAGMSSHVPQLQANYDTLIACIIHAVHITLLRSISRSYLLPRFISLVSHFPLLVVSKNCHIMACGHADTFLAWYDANTLLAQ